MRCVIQDHTGIRGWRPVWRETSCTVVSRGSRQKDGWLPSNRASHVSTVLRVLVVDPRFYSFIHRVSSAADVDRAAQLLVYYSLLQRTGLTHGDLVAILPPSTSDDCPIPSRFSVLTRTFLAAASLVFHPEFALFLPPLLVFIPAYTLGAFAARHLTKPREDESVAQYKGICGGAVFGVVSTIVGVRIASLVVRTAFVHAVLSRVPLPAVWRLVGTVTTIYCTTWLLFRWHNALVPGKNFSPCPVLASSRLSDQNLAPIIEILSDRTGNYARYAPASVRRPLCRPLIGASIVQISTPAGLLEDPPGCSCSSFTRHTQS